MTHLFIGIDEDAAVAAVIVASRKIQFSIEDEKKNDFFYYYYYSLQLKRYIKHP